MNEKLSFVQIMLLSTLLPLGSNPSLWKRGHESLQQLRQRCFYHRHPELPWKKREGEWGFIRPSDHRFYRLGPEQTDE